VGSKKGEYEMVDWVLAIKIAGGGFGLVFMLLALLGISVWVTKIVVGKVEQEK